MDQAQEKLSNRRTTRRRRDAGLSTAAPPSRSANGSVLASALPPCILGHRLTLFNYHWLVYGAPESSFRNDFYFDILGIFLIRVFFFWFCTHLSWGCWCLKQSKIQPRSRCLECLQT